MGSQGDISFPLEAEMPYDWLSVCADSQPLSPFQQTIRRIFVIFCVAIFVIFSGYLLRENFFARKTAKWSKNNNVIRSRSCSSSFDEDVPVPLPLFHMKRLEMPNEDHFVRSIDDFVASLPAKPPKKNQTKENYQTN